MTEGGEGGGVCVWVVVVLSLLLCVVERSLAHGFAAIGGSAARSLHMVRWVCVVVYRSRQYTTDMAVQHKRALEHDEARSKSESERRSRVLGSFSFKYFKNFES